MRDLPAHAADGHSSPGTVAARPLEKLIPRSPLNCCGHCRAQRNPIEVRSVGVPHVAGDHQFAGRPGEPCQMGHSRRLLPSPLPDGHAAMVIHRPLLHSAIAARHGDQTPLITKGQRYGQRVQHDAASDDRDRPLGPPEPFDLGAAPRRRAARGEAS
jgi:hypothetical protein